MKHKSYVARGMIVLFVLVTFTILLGFICNTLQTFNPLAAAIAALVAVLGMTWLKKSNR